MSRNADEDVKKHRAQIDKIDLQILELMNKRAGLAVQIGKLKNTAGGIVFSPSREEEVIQILFDHNDGPLPPVTIRSVYRELISGSRSLQRVLKIAYLGPEYSFSHLAALKQFGSSVDSIGVANIAAIFEEVNRRPVTDVAELKAAVKASGERPALMLVTRKGASIFLTVEAPRA